VLVVSLAALRTGRVRPVRRRGTIKIVAGGRPAAA
jgi:hypothetical protein